MLSRMRRAWGDRHSDKSCFEPRQERGVEVEVFDAPYHALGGGDTAGRTHVRQFDLYCTYDMVTWN